MPGCSVVSGLDFPIRPGQDPTCDTDKKENHSEDGVDLQCEDEEGEECKPPNDKVECNTCIVLR